LKQIITDITYIDKPGSVSTKVIEKTLTDRFGELIRWAVIEVLDDKLKVCLTYEKNN